MAPVIIVLGIFPLRPSTLSPQLKGPHVIPQHTWTTPGEPRGTSAEANFCLSHNSLLSTLAACFLLPSSPPPDESHKGHCHVTDSCSLGLSGWKAAAGAERSNGHATIMVTLPLSVLYTMLFLCVPGYEDGHTVALVFSFHLRVCFIHN